MENVKRGYTLLNLKGNVVGYKHYDSSIPVSTAIEYFRSTRKGKGKFKLFVSDENGYELNILELDF
jgi:hypothetical protein